MHPQKAVMLRTEATRHIKHTMHIYRTGIVPVNVPTATETDMAVAEEVMANITAKEIGMAAKEVTVDTVGTAAEVHMAEKVVTPKVMAINLVTLVNPVTLENPVMVITIVVVRTSLHHHHRLTRTLYN